MKSYSVLERPAPADGDPVFVLVDEGFNWWAFVVPPLWLLARRQWLGLAAFIAASGVLAALAAILNLEPGITVLSTLIFAALIGAEANDWRRWRMEAAGYHYSGVIQADNFEVAEYRWVERWLAARAPTPAPESPSQTQPKPPPRRPSPLQPFANPFDPM